MIVKIYFNKPEERTSWILALKKHNWTWNSNNDTSIFANNKSWETNKIYGLGDMLNYYIASKLEEAYKKEKKILEGKNAKKL